MGKISDLFRRINNNIIAHNLMLAVCGIVVMGVVVSLMLNLFTRHNMYTDVPQFVGMDIVEAREQSSKASLQLEINDSIYVPGYPGGVVLEQSPSVGTQVKSGRRIFVTLNSFSQKMVEIPYVTGYSLRHAKNNLEMAGLEIFKIVYQPDIATNNVIEQRYKDRVVNPNSKMEAEYGSGVTLIVGWGEGSTNPVSPKVVGFPLKEAKSRLWEAGLNVGNVAFDDQITLLEQKDAKVYLQTPGQGTRLLPGSVVSLLLTIDPQKVEKGSKDSDKSAKKVAKDDATDATTTN